MQNPLKKDEPAKAYAFLQSRDTLTIDELHGPRAILMDGRVEGVKGWNVKKMRAFHFFFLL